MPMLKYIPTMIYVKYLPNQYYWHWLRSRRCGSTSCQRSAGFRFQNPWKIPYLIISPINSVWCLHKWQFAYILWNEKKNADISYISEMYTFFRFWYIHLRNWITDRHTCPINPIQSAKISREKLIFLFPLQSWNGHNTPVNIKLQSQHLVR